MKSAYVADLIPEQSITTFFLVCEKEIRQTQTGKAYLRLKLGDRTGTIDATMWERFEQAAPTFERDDFLKVQAHVELYRGNNQLKLMQIRRAENGEVEPSDYYPHTTEDIEKLSGALRAEVESIANPWLQKLVRSVVEDAQVAPQLKRAPAAKMMHHAFVGGLLEHMVSLCGLCRAVAARYAEVDCDLLMTGAILHDVGKTLELTYDRSFGYSDEGQLLGHILIAYELVSKKADAIENFPPQLKCLVQHMLISHHGQYEFGSPKLPMFREAVLLHMLDDLDSKMGAMRATLASNQGEGDWTARNSALNRVLLRVDTFLQQPQPAGMPEQQRGASAGKKP